MAKYKFIKNFTARVNVGGAKGLENKSFTVGDVYEGEPKGDFVKIRIAPHSSINDGNIGSAMYQETLDVPKEYLQYTPLKNPLFYVLLTIGVLTLGYFAYKKLKK
jgi:hypothetical protein